ncbi:MAG: rRNA pseudouridine synthase [Oscillospiraceae bacterium]|nr:rRNA pseudouridine synthase [Oscillospiraceae bacterium]
MKERLQKIIAAAGVTSRRGAEELIARGRVTVNGVCAVLGDTADGAADRIAIDGKELPRREELVYIMLNKPKGYLTAMSDDRGRKTVAELVEGCRARVVPVGRLDLHSEGLLLMTNDGDAAYRVTHPSHMIEKEYHVWVSGDAESAIGPMNASMDIEGYTIRPGITKILRTDRGKTVLSVTITEGRKRQVRLMCAACGLTVHRLLRVREGKLHLADLPSGKWRYLTENEINYLKEQ